MTPVGTENLFELKKRLRFLKSYLLFIMQNYTDSANGNVPLTLENV